MRFKLFRHLLSHHGVHAEAHFAHLHLAALILVEDKVGLILLVRLQLAIDHRYGPGAILGAR